MYKNIFKYILFFFELMLSRNSLSETPLIRKYTLIYVKNAILLIQTKIVL